jgi:hypothetical protein
MSLKGASMSERAFSCRWVSIPSLRLAAFLALAAMPWAAHAESVCQQQIALVFTESAPRDMFEIRNGSSKGQLIQRLVLDLAPSAGRLVFDTLAGGTGVDVFQPFRAEAGQARLADAPEVKDGADHLELTFARFDAGQRFRFSIDVDDRLTTSDMGQTRISGREMEGAVLTVVLGPDGERGTERTARVGQNNAALIEAACL